MRNKLFNHLITSSIQYGGYATAIGLIASLHYPDAKYIWATGLMIMVLGIMIDAFTDYRDQK